MLVVKRPLKDSEQDQYDDTECRKPRQKYWGRRAPSAQSHPRDSTRWVGRKGGEALGLSGRAARSTPFTTEPIAAASLTTTVTTGRL